MIGAIARHVQRRAVERVIAATILEIRPKPRTDPQAAVRRDSDIALVKQIVQIGAKQDAIANLMRPISRVRSNVRSLERRQRVFARHGTRSSIRVGNADAKRTLTEARLNHARRAIPRTWLPGNDWERAAAPPRQLGSAVNAFVPNAKAFASRQIVGLARYVRSRQSVGCATHKSSGNKVG